MADINLFLKTYNNYLSTFKDTSYDSENDEYLCMDTDNKVIDYDRIIAEKYPDSNQRPKSFDAIYIQDENIYLIEFKNEKKPNKKEITDKLVQGKKELDNLLYALNIQKKKYSYIFCLVYNPYKPKHERFKEGLFRSASYEFLRQYIKQGLVDDIYTENVNFFTKAFKNKLEKELAC